ncbi:MAG: carboxypeptidase-like regulatory domain-containing protein [Dysgonamonadaceae bacterium]|nr:carboxypeptidase-like regulatory domain-containing protein [Dysgonamonadaceae bacterium]
MKNIFSLLIWTGMLSFFSPNADVFAQPGDSVYTVQGRILGGDTREPLANASITVKNLNVASVANREGYFTLRVPVSARNAQLLIRHIGYENKAIPVATLLDKSNFVIVMNPLSIKLADVEVVSGDGSELMKKALQRIPANYPDKPNMMIAFYRESVKKGSSYISLVEAVLDVYKSSYKSFEGDHAKIYIGRKATHITPRDTVLFKLQGGISDVLLLDIAKNPELVFGEAGEEYHFRINGLININDKPHYIISFYPVNTQEILFRGTVYLETQSLAFARMEFNLNVENRKDAYIAFIRRKPAKMKVAVNRAQYVADFVEQDGKWYFNYSKTDVSFGVRWTNRFFGLFATNYTIGSEIAITDRYQDNASKFPKNERIRSTDVIAEKVEYFQDPDFWGDYNIIEPDKEITNAIKKLSSKLLRRDK